MQLPTKKLNFIVLLSLLLIWVSCKNTHTPDTPIEDRSLSPQSLMDVNKFLVEKDRESIVQYAENNGLKLKETETGLFYAILKPTQGLKPTDNDVVKLAYKVKLLDGKLCYSSDSTGLKEFMVGKGGAEKGLDQGVRLMSLGSRAIFILPPYLAHGLTGDQICIPPRAIIIYEIDLLSLQKPRPI